MLQISFNHLLYKIIRVAIFYFLIDSYKHEIVVHCI